MQNAGLLWVEAHPSRDFLTMACQDGRILHWDLQRGGLRQLDQIGRPVQLRWSPNGQQLLALERAGQLKAWDAMGRSLGRLTPGFDTLATACYDGTRVALAGSLGGQALARVGRIGSDGWVEDYQVQFKQAGEVRSLVLLEDTLVLGFDDGFFESYGQSGKENPAGGQVFSGAVSAMAWSPERKLLAMGGNRGGLLTMKMDPWVVAESWPRVPPRPIAVNQVCFTRQHLAAACSDDCTRLIDWNKGVVESDLGTPFWLRHPKPEWNQSMILPSLCFDPARARLYVAHYLGGLSCWDPTTQTRRAWLDLDDSGHWRVESAQGESEAGSGATPSRLWQAL